MLFAGISRVATLLFDATVLIFFESIDLLDLLFHKHMNL